MELILFHPELRDSALHGPRMLLRSEDHVGQPHIGRLKRDHVTACQNGLQMRRSNELLQDFGESMQIAPRSLHEMDGKLNLE